MPSLNDAIGQDLSGYGAVPEGSGPQVATSQPSQMPANSGWTRSPLPILSSTSDNLRLFYTGPSTPQQRIYSPKQSPVIDLVAQATAQTAQATAQRATNTATAAARTANGSAMSTGNNSNGSWVKIGNFLQQFGTVTIASTSSPTTVTFPVNFVTSNINVQVTAASDASAGFVNVVSGSISPSGFEVVTGVAPQLMNWSAQGF
jgi:hypothetical protein